MALLSSEHAQRRGAPAPATPEKKDDSSDGVLLAGAAVLLGVGGYFGWEWLHPKTTPTAKLLSIAQGVSVNDVAGSLEAGTPGGPLTLVGPGPTDRLGGVAHRRPARCPPRPLAWCSARTCPPS